MMTWEEIKGNRAALKEKVQDWVERMTLIRPLLSSKGRLRLERVRGLLKDGDLKECERLVFHFQPPWET